MAKKKKGTQTKALPTSVTTFEITGDDPQSVYYTQYDEQRNMVALKGDGITVESDLPDIEQYITDDGLLRVPKNIEGGDYTIKTVTKDVQYEGDIAVGNQVDEDNTGNPDTGDEGIPDSDDADADAEGDDDEGDDEDPAFRELDTGVPEESDAETADDDAADNPAPEDGADDSFALPDRIDSTDNDDAKFTHVDESGFYAKNDEEADTSLDAPVQPDPEEPEDAQPSVIPGGATDESGTVLDDTTVTYSIETHGQERSVEGELDDLAAAMFDDLRSNQNSSLLRDGHRVAMMRRVPSNGQHMVDVLYFAAAPLPEDESGRIVTALRGYENRLVIGAKPIQ